MGRLSVGSEQGIAHPDAMARPGHGRATRWLALIERPPSEQPEAPRKIGVLVVEKEILVEDLGVPAAADDPHGLERIHAKDRRWAVRAEDRSAQSILWLDFATLAPTHEAAAAIDGQARRVDHISPLTMRTQPQDKSLDRRDVGMDRQRGDRMFDEPRVQDRILVEEADRLAGCPLDGKIVRGRKTSIRVELDDGSPVRTIQTGRRKRDGQSVDPLSTTRSSRRS